MKRSKNKIILTFDLFSILVPFLWPIIILVSFVDIYFYPGAFLKHTSFDPILIYLFFGLVALLASFSDLPKKIQYLILFQKLNYYSIYFFGLSLILLPIVNRIFYANFVFSVIHIQPSGLITPLEIAIFTYAISFRRVFVIGVNKVKTLYKIGVLISAIMIWVLFQNFTAISAFLPDIGFMMRNPGASYKTIMEYKLGKTFYDYTIFITNNTPRNSKILLPPFPAYPWPQTGNFVYMRYFLYPRELVSGNEYEPNHDLVKEKFDYVLIAWGETPTTSGNYTHGWPKFDVNAQEIVYWNKDSGKIAIKTGNYVYSLVKGQELWGLIKLKK